MAMGDYRLSLNNATVCKEWLARGVTSHGMESCFVLWVCLIFSLHEPCASALLGLEIQSPRTAWVLSQR